MISVCVASYNGGAYIYQQILSILSQIGHDDEIIVSDDGSTDNTIEILSSIKDLRVRIIRGPGKGLIKNFENALFLARGEIIFLSDQDDIWMPGKALKCQEALSNERVSMVVTDCQVVDSSLKILHPSFFQLRKSGGNILKNWAKNSYLGCCLAFKRDVLQRSLPFPSKIPMHDWWLGLNAALTGQVVFLNEPLLQYRRHGANASSTAEVSKLSLYQKIHHRFYLALYLFLRSIK